MKEIENKVDEIIRVYFDIFEDDLGFSGSYFEDDDEEVRERMKMNYKYFKAGFLFANMDNK